MPTLLKSAMTKHQRYVEHAANFGTMAGDELQLVAGGMHSYAEFAYQNSYLAAHFGRLALGQTQLTDDAFVNVWYEKCDRFYVND